MSNSKHIYLSRLSCYRYLENVLLFGQNFGQPTQNRVTFSWVRGKATTKHKVDWLNCFYADEHYNKPRQTKPAGLHNHNKPRQTKPAGLHNHNKPRQTKPAGLHNHMLHNECILVKLWRLVFTLLEGSLLHVALGGSAWVYN